MKLLSLAALAVALSGCIAPPRGHVPPARLFEPFIPEEHSPYRVVGPYKFEGQAFLRQKGGGIVTCAGAPVLVAPATNFMREVLSFTRAGGNLAAQKGPGEQFNAILRTGQCDAQGNFSMAGLPPGRWIVATGVEWTVGYQRQGGMLQREVDIPTTDKVLLSDEHFVGPARSQ